MTIRSFKRASLKTPANYRKLLAGNAKFNPIPDGLTAASAVVSAKQLKIDYPNSPSGVYWVKFADLSTHQILFDMTTDGGGWMNVHKSFGPYASALTSTWGTGGSDFLSGITGTSNIQFVSANSYNSQSCSYGCGTPTAAESSIYVNKDLYIEKGVTAVRVKGTLISRSGGYIDCAGVSRGDFTTVNLISGNQKAWGECSGTGFGAYTSAGDVFDVRLGGFPATPTNNVRVVGGHTACACTNVTYRIDGIWIR